MRVGRGWGMLWDMDVLACLLGLHFSYLLHHSCKFVVLSRLIGLHLHEFVVKEKIGLKVSGDSGVNVANAHGQQNEILLNSSRAVRAGGWVAD